MYDSDVSRPIKEIITNYLVSNYVGDCNDCDIIILPGEQPMDIPILYNANKIGKNTKVHCFFNILSDELNHGRREDKIRYYNAMIRKNIKIETNDADFANDSIIIEGVPSLSGGVVDSANDHRIAMMAAILAAHATEDVVVRGAHCVSKSYPGFWDDFQQDIRQPFLHFAGQYAEKKRDFVEI